MDWWDEKKKKNPATILIANFQKLWSYEQYYTIKKGITRSQGVQN